MEAKGTQLAGSHAAKACMLPLACYAAACLRTQERGRGCLSRWRVLQIMAAMYTSADEEVQKSIAHVVAQVVGTEKTVAEWADSVLGGKHASA